MDICTLPAQVGDCRASVPAWYYNSVDGTCKEFTYGGCGGNDNNFNTQQLCEKACKKKTGQLPSCDLPDF